MFYDYWHSIQPHDLHQRYGCLYLGHLLLMLILGLIQLNNMNRELISGNNKMKMKVGFSEASRFTWLVEEEIYLWGKDEILK